MDESIAANESAVGTPKHLWAVGVIAVLFNAVGAIDYVMSKTKGAEYMASAGMTSEQVAFVLGYPMWMTTVWAIGVWGAFIGSLFLLLRKKVAFPLLVASITAWFTSLIYTYVLTDGGSIMGQSMVMMSVVITAVMIFLVWYARAMVRRGVLR